jgi:dehydrogenase/reductase SDR family member 12
MERFEIFYIAAGKLISTPNHNFLPVLMSSFFGSLLYLLNPFHTRLGYVVRSALCFRNEDTDVSLVGKRFIVTGANAGIGFQIALGLAQHGAHVHMLCRSKERGEQAVQSIIAECKERTGKDTSTNVTLHIVDLSLLHDIDKFTSTFIAHHKELHCLVNNAAVMMEKRSETEEGLETVCATNLIGFYGLTEKLWALLKSSGTAEEPSRIVNVVSAGMFTHKLRISDFNATKRA